FAALGVLGGVGERLVESALGGADRERGDVDAAAGQRGHRGAVAGRFVAADERGGRHADLVERDARGPGALLAHLGVLRSHRDTGRVGRYQEDGDAGVARVWLGGAREDDEQVG